MTDIKKEFFPAYFAIIRGITKQSNSVKDLNNTMDMQFNNQYKKESSDPKKSSSTPSRHLFNITEYTTHRSRKHTIFIFNTVADNTVDTVQYTSIIHSLFFGKPTLFCSENHGNVFNNVLRIFSHLNNHRV